MEKRKFAIPAIALGFTALTLTGCPLEDKDEDEDEEDEDDGDTDGGSAGIDGTWNLTSYAYYGESYPFEYTYEYNGYSYTSSISATMTISSPSADFTLTQSYYTDYAGGYDSSYSETYSGTVTDNGSSYGIDFTDWMTLDCSLSGSSLSCVGVGDDAGLELGFSR